MSNGKKVNILVVVDNEFARRSLRSILQMEEDYVVVGEASNGETGLELALKLNPDIVCLDVEMPKCSGLEVLQRIMEKMPRTVVLMVSGSHDAHSLQTARERGAAGYINKPLNAGKVLDCMRQVVANLRERKKILDIHDIELLPPSDAAPALPRTRPDAKHLPTLLVVDDEPSILSALTRDLKSLECHTLFASSAANALEILVNNNVAAVLSDHRMPGMTGIELLSRVKTLYPHTVRIAFSGYADRETVKEAVKMGAIFRFVTKPWDKNDLCKVLQSAFQKYEQNLHGG